MRAGRSLALVAAAALAGALLWTLGSRARVVKVAPGEAVGPAIRAAAGDVVRLLPGAHASFEVDIQGATIEAAPGATVRGPVAVMADDVTFRGLSVVGGDEGVTVRGVDGVVLEDVRVDGATLHGIEVVDASASISGCRIEGLISPYAQGLEVRNATRHPRTVVEGCTVSGGQEGLVTHSSRVEFDGNHVTGTSMRAIAITEMSEGVMRDNSVTDVVGIGLYCGDMSHCEIAGNQVWDVTPDPNGLPGTAGHGIVAWYYSTVRLHGNVVESVASERTRITHGSKDTDRFPLAVWSPGWQGALPAVPIAAGSVAALGGVALIAAPWARRARRNRRSSAGAAPWWSDHRILTAVAVGFAVQSFHMLEHVVQVIQVYVVDGERRSGLLGAAVDTEWLHFLYNAAVLALAVWLWCLVRSAGRTPGVRFDPAPLVLAAVMVQGYHVAEHTAKLLQHLIEGINPAPGLIGGRVGLVWFHFGINLAVYAGLAIPGIVAVRRLLAGRRRTVPQTAAA
ncbi:MAG: right-handed parallel beta-helix repeat-containing protein [Actinomycetota bacterium]